MDQRLSVEKAAVVAWLKVHPNCTVPQIYKAFPDYAEPTLRKYRNEYLNSLLDPEADSDPQSGSKVPQKSKKPPTTPPQNRQTASGGDYTSVDEQMVKENLLHILNDPDIKPQTRLQATQLCMMFLKEKDALVSERADEEFPVPVDQLELEAKKYLDGLKSKSTP